MDTLKAPNGHGVDRHGGPVIDPSKNVEDSIAALKEFVVSLRTSDEKLANERASHIEFVAKLRASNTKELRELSFQHTKEMRDSDNERLIAQRREDQSTAAADKKTVLDAVQALAVTTESVRLQLEKRVADTATTLSSATAEGNKSTETRIAALEKSSYTGAGEKSISDPALVLLAQSVADLAKASTGQSGERRGNERMWAALAVGVSILTALGSLAFTILHATGGRAIP